MNLAKSGNHSGIAPKTASGITQGINSANPCKHWGNHSGNHGNHLSPGDSQILPPYEVGGSKGHPPISAIHQDPATHPKGEPCNIPANDSTNSRCSTTP